MAPATPTLEAPFLDPGLTALQRGWGFYLALGLFLVLLGGVAIATPLFATLAGVLMFGWLLIVSGLVQLFGAFGSRRWSGYFLHLLGGVLALVVGVMTLRHPGTMDLALTLLIATYLLVGGGFRMLGAVESRFHGRGWMILGGLLSALLGVYIYATLPIASLWVIGTFLGVDIVVHGWMWIFLAMALRGGPRD